MEKPKDLLSKTKEYNTMILQSKANQPISINWVRRQLNELIIIGTVRDIKTIDNNTIEMKVKSTFVSMVRVVLIDNLSVARFYEKESEV